MPALDRETRNQTQRDYVARNREAVNARQRKELPVKVCRHCGAYFKSTQVYRRWCYTCYPPLDLRAAQMLRDFDVSRPEYDAMYEAQEGLCAITGCTNKAVAIDHNHRTGRIRKLLCVSCNVFVGWYENTERLNAVAQYVKENG